MALGIVLASTSEPCRRRVVSWSAKAALFVYDLDLLVDHLSGKAADRQMHPVTRFAFDDEVGWEY